jgi:carbon-monoxide dehydrogenase small subunit
MTAVDVTIGFRLNGIRMTRQVPPGWTLLRYLRDGLGLTGTKCGCEIGECGACTVLLNREAVNACLVLAGQIDGVSVWTIEGVTPSGNEIHPIQRAFLDCDAVHCGFCSPGMVMSTLALLLHNGSPGDDDIKAALAGNLCRCTGYAQIIDAVKMAAAKITYEDLEKFK